MAKNQYGKFSEAEVEAGTKTGTGKTPSIHPSSGIFEEAGERGQTIKRAFGMDTSDMELEGERGGDCGGSTTNVSHSLKGISANPGPDKGNKSPVIPGH
jgi:hypothetical protein